VLAPLADGVVRVAALAAIYGFLAWLNIRGVRNTMRATAVVSIFKFAPLFLLVLVGAWYIEPSNLVFTTLPSAGSLSSAVIILFFAFLGIESALCTSGEVVRPERTIPLGLGMGLLLVGALYLGLQTVGQGILGAGLATATDAPLSAIAQALFGAPGVQLILVATVASVAGVLLVDVLSLPRSLYALATQRLMPAFVARLHPVHRTPHMAILIYTGMAFALAATGTFRQLVLFAAGGTLLMHVVNAMAVLKLCRMPGYADRPAFRAPFGAVVPVLTIVSILALVGTLTWPEIGALALLCVLAALPALRLMRA
jgi:basic amino acid/polyamine antiporter, APA family